jgi:glycosyltransferase involved in cell wall biosynthesis
MPLYNKTDMLREALDALKAQTFWDYRLVVLDDSTDPEPGRIVAEYASEDARIMYRKNPVRKGMVGNWRACVDAADEAQYFAWVSDHDLVDARWLETLVGVLDAQQAAVLAYPITEHLQNDGKPREKKLVHMFSTRGLSDSERATAVCLQARGFGKMVYGLFRTEALRRAGVFRRLFHPDVMLLLELSQQGEFHQVEEKLWKRRRTAKFSVSRQRQTLFAQKPWYAYLPWPVVNFCALLWNLCLRPGVGDKGRRWQGLRIAFMYLSRWSAKFGEGSFIGSYHEWRHGKKPWMKRLKNRLNRNRKGEIGLSDDPHKNHDIE